MKKMIIALLILSLLTIGCQEQTEEVSEKECSKDSDCKISGCNSEICSKEEIHSICIAKPEFACYKSAKCRCINYKCGWEQTQTLTECLTSNGG